MTAVLAGLPQFLLQSLLSATLILALGLVLTVALRRQSAALRHAVLTTTIVCALLMPALEVLLPQLPILPWGESSTLRSTSVFAGEIVWARIAFVEPEVEQTTRLNWPMLISGVWAAGMLLMIGGLLTSLLRLRRLRASCTQVNGRWRTLTDELTRQAGIHRRVDLLQSDDPSLLVTCGVFRPSILLPTGASDWPEDRQRIVLCHELAHIKRHDAAIQLVGELLRVVQPFNPLVWTACRRLRQESEYACDDAVLGTGVEATAYATHLFDIATRLSGRQTQWASAPAIAHPSTLERRIVAMLNKGKNREPLARRGWTLAVALAVAVSLPLAAIGVGPSRPAHGNLPAPALQDAGLVVVPAADGNVSEQTSLTGRIMDQSGGMVPGATVKLTNVQTQAAFETTTTAPGEFSFPALPSARYELEARLPGFRHLIVAIELADGAPVDVPLTLAIGSLAEEITISCGPASPSILQRLFPVLSAQERPNVPVRIGGGVTPPKKITNVDPTCPGGAAENAVVVLEGRIGIDGVISDIKPLANSDGTEPPTMLYDSAEAAMEQWAFTPTLLNKMPIEVTMTLTVNFTVR